MNVQSDQAHSDERPLRDRNMKYLQTTFQMIENNIRRLDNDVQGEQIVHFVVEETFRNSGLS